MVIAGFHELKGKLRSLPPKTAVVAAAHDEPAVGDVEQFVVAGHVQNGYMGHDRPGPNAPLLVDRLRPPKGGGPVRRGGGTPRHA